MIDWGIALSVAAGFIIATASIVIVLLAIALLLTTLAHRLDRQVPDDDELTYDADPTTGEVKVYQLTDDADPRTSAGEGR